MTRVRDERISSYPAPLDGRGTRFAGILQSYLGERWFDDRARNSFRAPKTASRRLRENARRQRARDVKMLRRHGGDDRDALQIAEKISRCEAGRRCLSGYCSECMTANQCLFVALTSELLGRVKGDVSVISVVDCDCRFAEGELSHAEDMFADLRVKLQRALLAAGVKWAFGGFDVSANEHRDDRFAPHYRPHAWVIALTSQIERGETIFRSYFPRSATVRKPVVIKPFDRDPRGLAYAVKTDFVRRISLPKEKAVSGRAKRRNTRDRPLLARQRLELATALDRVGLNGRVFLCGLRVVVNEGVAQFKRRD